MSLKQQLKELKQKKRAELETLHEGKVRRGREDLSAGADDAARAPCPGDPGDDAVLPREVAEPDDPFGQGRADSRHPSFASGRHAPLGEDLARARDEAVLERRAAEVQPESDFLHCDLTRPGSI